jgi:hypothetical protein
MLHVPVPLVMAIAPAASTVHAVEEFALKLYAPDPLPPDAIAVRPVWPNVASLAALTVTGACTALLILNDCETGAAGL